MEEEVDDTTDGQRSTRTRLDHWPEAAATPSAEKRSARSKANGRSSTRDRILGAALREFAKSGLHATSVHAIATRAQVAHGTVLWHFGSKPMLYAAAVRHVGDRLLGGLQMPAARPCRSLADVLAGWLSWLNQHGEDRAILGSAASDCTHPEVARAARELNDRFARFWLDWLDRFEASRPSQSIATKEEIARLIVATITGVLATGYDPDTRTLSDFANFIEGAACR